MVDSRHVCFHSIMQIRHVICEGQTSFKAQSTLIRINLKTHLFSSVLANRPLRNGVFGHRKRNFLKNGLQSGEI